MRTEPSHGRGVEDYTCPRREWGAGALQLSSGMLLNVWNMLFAGDSLVSLRALVWGPAYRSRC